MRIVFMGTPSFAVPVLEALIAAGAYEIVGVVTQPDAPSGRGRSLAMSAVKEQALAHGLTVLQPERVRRPESVAALRDLAPDVQIVAAFGQILPRSVLDIPARGTLNVHASLLPRWRGAAPITAAILAGDAETGVTIMRLDEGMDTGDILAQAQTAILAADTTGSLSARLADIGARLLVETLPRWARGEITPQPQDNNLATMCRPIRKESGRLDWSQPAGMLERAVRAYAPWPGTYTTWNGKLLKVLAARGIAGKGRAEPGTVVATAEGPAVVTGDGMLLLVHVQPEGKKAMPVRDFVAGHRDFVGARLT
jgi:methionyl-tRNA formyltransferase